MKRSLLAVAALAATASFGHAELIKMDESLVVFGSGLGAVNTLVTVHDSVAATALNAAVFTAPEADTTATCAAGTEITERDNIAINIRILFSKPRLWAGNQHRRRGQHF